MKQPPEILEEAAQTYRERNKLYADNYKQFGELLLWLFPGGRIPPIGSVQEANRLNLIINCLCKLQRYAYQFKQGGHKDSAHDLIVYAAMLEEMTNDEG